MDLSFQICFCCWLFVGSVVVVFWFILWFYGGGNWKRNFWIEWVVIPFDSTRRYNAYVCVYLNNKLICVCENFGREGWGGWVNLVVNV